MKKKPDNGLQSDSSKEHKNIHKKIVNLIEESVTPLE